VASNATLTQGLNLPGCGLLFCDFAFERQRAGRKGCVACLAQKGIEAAAMLDGAQGRGCDAHADAALQDVGDQGHIAEVRQKSRPGLAVRVGDDIAAQHGLAGQFATA
jgi:hypothetical protein